MLTLLLFSALLQDSAASDREKQMEVLRTGHTQWQRDVAYRSECEWRRTAFDSEQEADAFAWNWETVDADKVVIARGHVAKLGQRIRVCYNPARPPESQRLAYPESRHAALSDGVLRGVGYDEMANGRFEAIRTGANSRKFQLDRILVARADYADRMLPSYCTVRSIGEATPVRPLKMRLSDPFELSAYDNSSEAVVDEPVKTNARGNVEVVLSSGHDRTFVRRVLELTPTERPLLISLIESYVPLEEGALPSGERIEVVIGDLIEIDGVGVPQKIRHKIVQRDGGVAVFEYRATSTVRPTLADFRMHVPKDVPLQGLSETSKLANQEYLGLDELSDRDIPN